MLGFIGCSVDSSKADHQKYYTHVLFFKDFSCVNIIRRYNMPMVNREEILRRIIELEVERRDLDAAIHPMTNHGPVRRIAIASLEEAEIAAEESDNAVKSTINP